ncbi:UV radiation resistance protein [Helicobacter pylori X47-2AL]|uniref:UV radiation resistance protein n=2 Tax=Bacteria TaxID=2 RepID=V6L8H8_HELPX|nr:UV radiation resistance protein [Helicobacter pylori]EST40011.1 UV radiation resistance protein [Helicobacter pylori X47-2AL]MUT42595.1 UV radiation resistance protein [Helicobacter pylori]MUT74746.1 UV radiation resistance protein [Helicobacter pylori]MUT82419.1 UV radiation resistance protein [Helicobacter pylori]
MSWIDISVGSGSSGQGSSNNLLSGFINSLGNALSNASASGGLRGFPWKAGNENDQIVGYYDDPQGYYSVIKKFLAEKNYHSNERLKSAFERIINIQNRINQLNHEINAKENAINSLNNEINHLNQETEKQNQALNNLNQEIASINHEISANDNAINQEQEKLNALELQTNAKKEVLESLKKLEKLKQELKRLKNQSKWKKQFNFLTDNPPNVQAKQESALNRAGNKNALMNFFLTDPYAILPKGFIYEYHNPGKETYNALNAPNNMDGINNQFRVNALNQVLDNSYQKFLPGNDSFNSLGGMEQVKALKFYDLVINFNLGSENLESALFFKQISQYAKGLRLKILTAPSTNKDLKRLKKLENAINQEEERLKGKDLNALNQEIQKEQENALKLKESIKASQNHTETLKNAINQKEHAKNPIEQQKQNLERQKHEKEREKQNQESAKQEKEREKQNLNNKINAIGNERVTIKELGTKDNFLGIQTYFNDKGRERTYARAFFSDKNKSIKEYYEIETKIKNILGFYRIGQSDEVVLKRFLELSSQQQNEIAQLILQG